MRSVTQRIKEIKQPKGGYIKPSSMQIIQLEDQIKLNKVENISPSLVGLVVDYMTRFLSGTPKEKAFYISLLGASKINEGKKAKEFLENINGLDEHSIRYACKLVGYDVCFRAGITYYKEVNNIEPDKDTIFNIKIMIERSIDFFIKYGPVVQDGITFEGGYTSIIGAGDADFMTKDTIWDFKVSKLPVKKEHTLQLLVYYLMGKHTNNQDFEKITKLGIYNPRINTVYLKNISEIEKSVIEEVETTVIGYDDIYTEEKLLDMSEIMRVLNCSRYMVMKYYNEEELPLIKQKNRYYIDKKSLIEWIEMINEKRRREKITQIIISLIYLVIVFFIITALFYRIGSRL